MPRNTSVTLGEHFDTFVAEKIAEGRYQSVSEVVRAGLRSLEADEAKLEALKTMLQEGLDSPVDEGFEPELFVAELRAKYLADK